MNIILNNFIIIINILILLINFLHLVYISNLIIYQNIFLILIDFIVMIKANLFFLHNFKLQSTIIHCFLIFFLNNLQFKMYIFLHFQLILVDILIPQYFINIFLIIG